MNGTHRPHNRNSARAAARRTRSGHTLVELVVSVAVSALLLGGIMSTVAVTIRATDENLGPWKAISEGRTALDEIAGDLAYARSFNSRLAHAVEVIVADRDGDLADETIRYEWSGVAGEALTRKYNAETAVEVLEDVHQLDLSYTVETITGSTTRYFVRSVDLVLQVGPDAGARVETAVHLFNSPEVDGP